MAKKSYSLPASLDQTWWDLEIDLSSPQFKIGLVSIKSIIFYGGIGLFTAWLCFASPMKSAALWTRILFIVLMVIFAIYYGRYTATKELRIMKLKTLSEYTPSQRRINTRSRAKSFKFRQLTGIASVESTPGDDDGVIHYLDGYFGRVYRVSGSASILVFAEAQAQIVDRFSNFWKKVDPEVEIDTLTTKEPQPVYRQIASWAQQRNALEHTDDDLDALMRTERDALVHHVGERFSSIQQYLIVRAPTYEHLSQVHGVIRNEALDSSLVFKSVTTLGHEDAVEVLGSIYQPAHNSYGL